ncbi:sulfite exporter TauE/SafE family protein [Chryseobacterium sp. SIMBA_038]|uniref:sulfite exporter TauE/SafE family protein n=1 Tax=Chryseobacterium sp. SIMBA_038 TaxID=3085780 RepID=UPI00397CFF91
MITAVIVAIAVFSMYEMGYLDELLTVLEKDDHIFYWMLLVGVLAEIVAGSMGMGYGVICTTTLLFLNIPPHIVSASIHSAESFTTAAGSISHFKLKNISVSLVKKLAIPAIIGAVIGALSLTYVGEYYSKITKTVIAFYTLYLGIQILSNAFKPKQNKALKRKTNLTRLGLIGGFIDSFAGGGWGPLVTGTLIKNAFTPRFAVGSSTVAKFILTITAAVTFFFTLGIQHWNIILGLLIGGIITAPFSAMLTAKLPVKKMFIVIGTLVIVMSCITIYKSVFS